MDANDSNLENVIKIIDKINNNEEENENNWFKLLLNKRINMKQKKN